MKNYKIAICSLVVVLAVRGTVFGDEKTSTALVPKVEFFAFCCIDGYLDGPKAEALAPTAKACSVDDKGNIYFVSPNGALQVVEMKGMVRTIAGEDRWNGGLAVDEGPAGFIPQLSKVLVYGDPMTDSGGYLLAMSDWGTPASGKVFKIWKNKEKGGKWWFKTVLGLGKGTPAGVRGKTIEAKEAGRGWDSFGRYEVEGKTDVYLMSGEGSIWRYDDVKGTLTCVLAFSDYKDHPHCGAFGVPSKRKDGTPLGKPRSWVITPDGSIYLNWYEANYPKGIVTRIWPDRSRIERVIVAADASVDSAWDGDALGQAAFFGGPLMVAGAVWPPDIIFLTAVDDCQFRRLKDGRISTLCKDGNWREFAKKSHAQTGNYSLYEECAMDKAPAWGRAWVMGDKGYYYQLYRLGSGDAQIYRIGPIDFGKPTIGTLAGGKKQ